MIANTPKPPYYTVIFSSQLHHESPEYEKIAQRMIDLVKLQPGFLGFESLRDSNGFGMTISYWSSLEAILGWQQNHDHQEAQEKGRKLWYKNYKIRICKVERDYEM